jgi:hypothetical protein
MLSRRVLLVLALTPGIAAACGSRTGLLVPPPDETGNVPDVFVPATDATAPVEDASEEVDASELDAVMVEEPLPPIEVGPPVVINDCPDAGATLVYVITEDGTLMSFFPPTGRFTEIGPIACPVTTAGAQPFSMAVDVNGIAYTVFRDQFFNGQLFRVSTAPTAPCERTTFISGQQGFPQTFGMGFSQDSAGTGETLFLAGDPVDLNGSPLNTMPSQLATLDTTTYALKIVGNFPPGVTQPELTGTGAGELYAFYSDTVTGGSAIGQIDKTTAQVVRQSLLPGLPQNAGWAFAFWGGDFYTFTGSAPGVPTSIVTRFDPNDGTIVTVATSDKLIVGAGVSTCAPQR